MLLQLGSSSGGLRCLLSRLERSRNYHGEGPNRMKLWGTAIVNMFSSLVKLLMGPRSAALGAGRTHAGGSTGAVGEDPYEATKRCAGWAKIPN
eukprot:4612653-Pyramimonas_sp.AAC.1